MEAKYYILKGLSIMPEDVKTMEETQPEIKYPQYEPEERILYIEWRILQDD